MTDEEIETLYLRHRRPFLGWSAKQFKLGGEDALDIYQEAMIAFVRNVRSGKVAELDCEPSTYLFAIGRNIALKHLRTRKGFELSTGHAVLEPSQNAEHDTLSDELHAQELIARGMHHLTEKEREVLRLYYFEDRSMTEIAEVMGYNNADVAKKMKYVSFRKLAALITKAVSTKSPVHAE